MANAEPTSNDDPMDIDQSISAAQSNNTSRIGRLSLHPCENLVEAIRVILQHDSQDRSYEVLSDHQADMLDMIQNARNPQTMFENICRYVADFFDIDVYIVGFQSGMFRLITDYACHKKFGEVYLLFSEMHTLRGILCEVFANNVEQIVFDFSNWSFLLDVQSYISWLNHESVSVANAPLPVDHLGTAALNPSTSTAGVQSVLENVLGHVGQVAEAIGIDPAYVPVDLPLSQASVNGSSSIERTVAALRVGIEYLSQLVHLVQASGPPQSNAPVEPQATDDTQSHARPLSVPEHMYSGSQNTPQLETGLFPSSNLVPPSDEPRTNEQAVTTPFEYPKPELVGEVKHSKRWRFLKEFAASGSSPITTEGSQERELLHIVVPRDNGEALYLGVTVYTHDERRHPLKIVVPHGTKVDGINLMEKNDLACLKLVKDQSENQYLVNERILFSRITRIERDQLRKDLKLHLIKLYQRNGFDRQRVRVERLKTAKLAMWFATLVDGTYQRVSDVFISNEFKET